MIPEQRPGKPDAVPVRAGDLKAWISALPLADLPEAVRRSINALHDLNRHGLPTPERLQLLALFAPLVHTLCTGLKKSYLTAAFPLSDKKAANAGLVQQLCAELAEGYKIVAVEIDATTSSNDAAGDQLVQAIYHSVIQLSRAMVESYAVYAPEPASAWFELHQLYVYAQETGVLERPVGGAGPNEPATILGAYKRMAMLALANPYQLMQGEASDAYAHLSAWTDNCRILAIDQAVPAGIEFVVDLDADKPPYYTHDEAGTLPKNGRRLDVSNLVNIVNAHVQAIAARSSKAGAQQQNNLFERRQRGLYQRIAQAWAVRSERISRRVTNPMQLAIIIGLTNSHYLMSGGAEFSPERDEIEMGKSSMESGNIDSLTLIDTDQTPWIQEEQATRLDTGINKPRTSKFGTPAEIGKDIWEKIFASPAQQAQHTRSSGVSLEPFLCRQQRESGNGLDAECDFNSSMQLRVGDLVAYQMENTIGQEWSIGAVIWLKSTSTQGLTFGINRLAEDAHAVATKALKGVGAGGEYYRALLTPRLDPREHPTTLITPAAVYDVGSMVALNMGTEMLYARLTKLLDNTYSYSRFRFELTERPVAALDVTKTKRIL